MYLPNFGIKPFCVFLCLFGLICACTTENSTYTNELNKAESLMEDKPDSALKILQDLRTDFFNSKREKARFSLLLSMALDKNYIDKTDFAVLQPALDYFLEKGTPDEMLKTLYYQGRIYLNQEEYGYAMDSFLKAEENVPFCKDSLPIARLYVANAALLDKQYKFEEAIESFLKAARIYHKLNKYGLAVKSYSNAADIEGLLQNKKEARDLINLCDSLVRKSNEGYEYYILSLISNTVNFRSKQEISDLLSQLDPDEFTPEFQLEIAKGYSTIGENKKALDIINSLKTSEIPVDTLKLTSVSAMVYEGNGDYKSAAREYYKFCENYESYHSPLFTGQLLFAEQKHKMEVENLKESQKKTNIIYICLVAIFIISSITLFVYNRYISNKLRRLESERMNQKLEGEQITLRMENAALDAAKQSAEYKSMQSENKLEKVEKEKAELEEEKCRLENLLEDRENIDLSVEKVIRERIDMLNSFLAFEITHNEVYYKPVADMINSIKDDKKAFMVSLRKAFAATNPEFISTLTSHGLTDFEINYSCLYALGLRGKEIGEYLNLKRHYNVSATIRKKLNLTCSDGNFGSYIKSLCH